MGWLFGILIILILVCIAGMGLAAILWFLLTAGVLVGYYYYWRYVSDKRIVPAWQSALYHTIPWIFMLVGGSLAFVGLIYFLVGVGSGDTHEVGKVCSWCGGYGCSHCENWGFYLSTETTYEDYGFLGGLLATLIGAVLALGGGIGWKYRIPLQKAPVVKKELTPAQKKTVRTISLVAALAASSALLIGQLVSWLVVPPVNYNKAQRYEQEGDYIRAALTFGELGNYRDAQERSWALWQQHAPTQTFDISHYQIGVKEDGTVITDGWTGPTLDWDNIIAVAAGENYALGLKSDGTMVSAVTKRNINYEASADVDEWRNIVAIAGGDHSMGLKPDGTVIYAGAIYGGHNPKGKLEDVTDWRHIVDICVGGNHAVGLQVNGKVVAVGNNDDSQCEVSGWRNIVDIAAGYSFTAGLRADGTVVATPSLTEKEGQVPVSQWRDIVAIDAGYYFLIGMQSDGTLLCCGTLERDISTWGQVLAFATMERDVIALTPEGRFLCTQPLSGSGWDQVKLPNGITINKEDLRKQHYTRGEQLLAEGDTLGAAMAFGSAAGYEDAWQRSTALWDTVADRPTLAGCDTLVAALRTDGSVICTQNYPALSTWQDVIAVAASANDVFGLKADGTVLCANGTYDLSDWQHIVSLSASDSHVAALRADGTVVTLGNNNSRQCEVYLWDSIIDIHTPGGMTMGIRADGTVVCADEENTQLSWSNVASLNTYYGNVHLGLKLDGTVCSKGESYFIGDNVRQWQYLKDICRFDSACIGLLWDGTMITSEVDADTPSPLLQWTDVVDICATSDHLVALRADGTLVSLAAKDHAVCDLSAFTGIALPQQQTYYTQQRYALAQKALAESDLETAAAYFLAAGDYEDAADQYARLKKLPVKATTRIHNADSYKVAAGSITYDAFGNEEDSAAQRTYENGELVKETFSDGVRLYKDGRIWSEEFTKWTLTSQWTHDEAGRLLVNEQTVTYSSGTVTTLLYTYTYDDAGQLVSEVLQNPSINLHRETTYEYRNGKLYRSMQTENKQETCTYYVYAPDDALLQELTYQKGADGQWVFRKATEYFYQWNVTTVP